MPRKAKKAMHRMPPLSFVDKLIYWTIFLLIAAADILLIFGPLMLRNTIAFADETVVAMEDNISVLWILIPQLTFIVTTFVLWYNPYTDRRPIFGKKNFKYGPPAWPKVYPLFMKNKPYVFVSERKRKERRLYATIVVAILLTSFIPFPLALFGRDCLYTDGSIQQYNMLNFPTKQFDPNEISELTIEVRSYSTGKYYKTRHWGVQLVFMTDTGKKYSFDHSDFRDRNDGEPRNWLTAMTAIKEYYDVGIIYYDNVEDLPLVLSDNEMSQEEAEILYTLFGQTYLPYQ